LGLRGAGRRAQGRRWMAGQPPFFSARMSNSGDFGEVLSAELMAVRDRLLAKHEEWLGNRREDGVVQEVSPSARKSTPPPLEINGGSDHISSRQLSPFAGSFRANSEVAQLHSGIREELRALRDSFVTLGSRLTTVDLGLVPNRSAENELTLSEQDATNAPEDLTFTLYPEWKQRGFERTAREPEVINNLTHWNSDMDPEVSEAIDSRRKCILNPNSNKRLAWEAFGILLLGFDIVFVPLWQAFPMVQTPIFKAVDLIAFCYWSLDMLITFRLAFHQKDGTLVIQTSLIAKRYLKSWFVFDIFVLFVDAISILKLDESQILRIGTLFRTLRVLRFLRLLRLAKLKSMLSEIRMRIDSQYLFLVLNIIQHVVFLLLANHLVACAWYWIGSAERTDRLTWVAQSCADCSVPYKYMTALHWSLTQFTPASMDVQPENLEERSFAVFVLVCALIIFGSFLSSITAAITALRQLDARHEGQFWLLRKYLRQNSISRELGTRVTRYLQSAVSRQKIRVQEAQVELLALLSGPLRVRLKKELFTLHCTHPFFIAFAKTSAVAMSKLCYSSLTQELFSKGDVLFHAREPARSMFLVIEGRLIYLMHGRVHDYVWAGRWCSEAALWITWVHRADMCANSECVVFCLEAERFRAALAQYPADSALARRYARLFAKLLGELNEMGEEVNDIRPGVAELEEVLEQALSTRNLDAENSTRTQESGPQLATQRTATL